MHIIMEKKELPIYPHFWPHTGSTLTQMVQNVAFPAWPSGTYSWWITPLLSKNNIRITFTFDFWNRNFLEGGVFGPHYLELWRFVSGSYAKHQLSSPVIVESKKFGVAFDLFNKVISVIKALFSLFGCQCMRHKPRAEFPFLQIFWENLLHDSFRYSRPFCYESTRRPTIFLQNIG